MSNKHSTNTAAVWVVGLIIVVSVVMYAGTNGFKTSFNISGTPTTGGSTQINTGLPCTSVTQTPQVSVKYPNPTLSPSGQLSLVASQAINAYTQPGSTTPAATATSSSSAPVALSGLNCGSTYLITAGSSTSGYFLNGTTFTLQQGATNPQVTVIAPQYTAPTLTFSNGSVASTPASQAFFHNVVASQTLSAVVYVQAGQYNDSEGPAALTITYNSLAVTPSISGLSPTGQPVPAPTFITSNAGITKYATVGSQNSQLTWLIPASSNFYYNSGTSGLSQTQGGAGITVTLKTTSGYVANTIVGVQYTAGTNFFSTYSGTLLADQFVNPQTQGNLYAPTAATSAIGIGSGTP